MTSERPPRITAADRFFAGLDGAPWNALFLGLIGYLFLPAFVALGGDPRSLPSLVFFLLCTLFLLRLAFLVLRRIFPFSQAVKEVWARRRELGRLHDSLKWRKMLWVGLGIGARLVVSGDYPPVQVGLAVACSIAGALGLVIGQAKGLPAIRFEERS